MAKPSSTISEAQRSAAEKEIKTKQSEVKYDIRDFTVDYIVQKYQEDLFYIPEYQREFVWDEEHQCRFIESIMLGLPIPAMFVADMDDGRLEIVDGAQRIRTLEAFMNSDLELKGLLKLPSLNGFRFIDLPLSQRRKFGTKALRIFVLEDSTSHTTRQELFDRINTSSVRAKASEIRRGAFSGPFQSFIQKCAKDETFSALCPVSSKQKLRREHEELALRFFTYSDKYESFKHDVDRFMNEYAEQHREKFDEKRLRNEFNAVMKFVSKHFPCGFTKGKSAKSTPRVRFEAIAVGVNLALRIDPNLEPSTPIADWIDSEEFRTETTTHASNSGPRLKSRVEFVRDKLLGKKEAT